MQIPILNGIYTDGVADFRVSYPVNLVPVPKEHGISKGYLRPAEGAVANGEGPGISRGCFNIRRARNGVYMSLHSWGLAVDVDANWNRLGQRPVISAGVVACFTDAGFEWGGTWERPDGMHFQLKELPK